MGDDTRYHLDALLSRLTSRGAFRHDDVINAWNILDDLRNSLSPDQRAAFQPLISTSLESYDRFFSHCGAADLLGLDTREEVSEQDLRAAIEAIATGALMLLAVTGEPVGHAERPAH